MLSFFKKKKNIFKNNKSFVFFNKNYIVFLNKGNSIRVLNVSPLQKGIKSGEFVQTKKTTNTFSIKKKR